MDNDNKIIIQKPEVELFLQDDIYAFNREKPKMYDLEKEFANVKKQKKHIKKIFHFLLSKNHEFVLISLNFEVKPKNLNDRLKEK